MKKFEKITLLTCIDTYGSTRTAGISALDELVGVISKHATEITLVDYDDPVEYALVKIEEVGQ